MAGPESFNKADKIEQEIDTIGRNLTTTDIKINPDYYLHVDLLNLQRLNATENLSVNEIYLRKKMIVQSMESTARGCKYIGDDYDQEIKKFISSEEYKAEQNSTLKMAMLTEKKIELMKIAMFDRGVIDEPLKI